MTREILWRKTLSWCHASIVHPPVYSWYLNVLCLFSLQLLTRPKLLGIGKREVSGSYRGKRQWSCEWPLATSDNRCGPPPTFSSHVRLPDRRPVLTPPLLSLTSLTDAWPRFSTALAAAPPLFPALPVGSLNSFIEFIALQCRHEPHHWEKDSPHCSHTQCVLVFGPDFFRPIPTMSRLPFAAADTVEILFLLPSKSFSDNEVLLIKEALLRCRGSTKFWVARTFQLPLLLCAARYDIHHPCSKEFMFKERLRLLSLCVTAQACVNKNIDIVLECRNALDTCLDAGIMAL